MENKKSPADLAQTVRREAYTYLGSLPKLLSDCPPGAERYVAGVALNVGKYLKWIAGSVDHVCPPTRCDADMQKLKTLADSILAVAVVLHDGKPHVTHRQRTMLLALDSLSSQLIQLRKEFDYEQAS